MNEEWLSAHLDGELSAGEERELEDAMVGDPELALLLDELAGIRSMLRAERVELPADTVRRVISAVAVDTDGDHAAGAPATLVALDERRRVPAFAAVAAALVIIASVVGGLGGASTVPALGDLLARHEVAAAVGDDGSMPDELAGMDPMPMEDASSAALRMPDDYSMEHAFVEAGTVHLLYRTRLGEPVSVFRQEGDVDLEALGEGSMANGDGAAMWSAPMDGSYVAVVDGDGYLWVVVGPTPSDDMMDDLMIDLPTRRPGVGERLRDAADAVVEPFRIWD